MYKKGMTLIELMVAVTLFIIVTTLAVGGFVTISRSRILLGSMKDTQQKVRVADEIITRLAKQAEVVKVSNDGKDLQLFFDLSSDAKSAKRFEITSPNGELNYYDCPTFTGGSVCPDGRWVSLGNLLGSSTSVIQATPDSIFSISGVSPALLNITLSVTNKINGSSQFDDALRVENAVILENVK